MQVLIVEDNSFNGFCLNRLINNIYKFAQITIVTHSFQALKHLAENSSDLIILDGNLASSDSVNGPALAGIIWEKYPHKPIIAWTDCENMRTAFAKVFKRHNKPLNEFTCWPKVISEDTIIESLLHLANTSYWDIRSVPQIKRA
ncbi:two component sensor and regulator, histidine kinase response regulator (plasmid) [Legionella adelaidensis]|uniref:Two component sensor and regulator histidine kinase response regulator n=1 Tax=Legionella adelaidensis TaxID=45056 RepID=A0A0W0R111_9GAMM|nr:response regulator [Legionella adelaidensis]KTC64651.1 two component sensor and regulator histidine kinase response regulator [Legionella adelaidensis]VEH86119.1 two component sensor and regulator, histidine kinase response regulator [Legionella adelaidensis]